MSKYRYVVELTRRVRVPFLGPYAHTLRLLTKDFSFGRGGEFKTGKDAEVAALAFATTQIPHHSIVSIGRFSKYQGSIVYMKDSDELFNCEYEGDI